MPLLERSERVRRPFSERPERPWIVEIEQLLILGPVQHQDLVSACKLDAVVEEWVDQQQIPGHGLDGRLNGRSGDVQVSCECRNACLAERFQCLEQSPSDVKAFFKIALALML